MIEKTSFPVFRNVVKTLYNWSPKLASISSNLASISKLAEWGTWNSEVYASGSMTISTTKKKFFYFRLFKVAFIMVRIDGTTGGTASNYIYFKLPIRAQSDEVLNTFAGLAVDGGAPLSAWGFIENDKETVRCGKYNGANWALGTARVVKVSGFYRTE